MTKRIEVEHVRTALRLAKMWGEHGPGLTDEDDAVLFQLEQLERSIAAHDEATEPTEAPRAVGLTAREFRRIKDAVADGPNHTALTLNRIGFSKAASPQATPASTAEHPDTALLRELHGYVADMCRFLGVDPEAQPADAWTLRDAIIRLKSELEASRSPAPTASAAPTRYANILGRIECALGVSGPDDDGQRVLAAIEQLQTAYRVSYENGQELARRLGQNEGQAAWIPCAERMPEDCTRVLLLNKSGEVSVGYKSGEVFMGMGVNWCGRADQVEFWSDIPGLPGVRDVT